MTELVLLAVTRMLSGVCIGGVPPGGGAWVRPVKPFGSLQLGDIRYADGTLMQPFDRVALNLQAPRPAPPHVEDVLCDFRRPRPQRLGRLTEPEREALLERCLDCGLGIADCGSTDCGLRIGDCGLGTMTSSADEARLSLSGNPNSAIRTPQSLALIEPPALTAAFAWDDYSEKFDCRLAWPGCDRPQGAAVTDLKWRALGREWVACGPHHQQYDLPALRRRLGFQRLFLAVGLSRNYEGQYWPIVVGIHLLPDYEATVDERRL